MASLLEKRNLRGLIIDCTITEEHSISTQSTDYPVANDSPMMDHMITNPRNITITGTIHDHAPKNYLSGPYRPRNLLSNPLLDSYRDREEAATELIRPEFLSGDAELQAVQNSVGVTNFGSESSTFDESSPRDRIMAAWSRIVEIADNKELCQLVTNLELYDDMIIESARASHDGDNCERLEFTITLKKIKRVSPEVTQITRIRTAGDDKKDNGDASVECLRFSDVFVNDSPTQFQPGAARIGLEGRARRGIVNGGTVFSPFTYEIWQDQVCNIISDRQINQFGSLRVDVQSRLDNPFNAAEITNISNDLCERVYQSNLSCFTSEFTREFCSAIGGGGDVAVTEALEMELRGVINNSVSDINITLTGDPALDSASEIRAELQNNPVVATNYGVEAQRNTSQSIQAPRGPVTGDNYNPERLNCYRELAAFIIEEGAGGQEGLFDLFRSAGN